MKAHGIRAYGEPTESLTLDLPEPGRGEVRVRIAACGLNFADLLLSEGRYQERPDPPLALGMEAAGWIDAAGPETDAPAPGTPVAIYANSGCLAEYACLSAARCIPLPDAMPFADAAAFQVAYGTSHLALDHLARLRRGETLLVLGAAGGVGLTAVEIGKLMGARVIAVANGAEKLSVARSAGADHLIDSATGDIRREVKALGGADVVYDPVGGDLFDAAFRATNPGGRILVIGFAGGRVQEIPANHMLVKNISVLGFYWGGYLTFRPEALTGSLTTLLDWYSKGSLKPHISHILPLDSAGEALDLLRARKSTGKVVVRVAEEE